MDLAVRTRALGQDVPGLHAPVDIQEFLQTQLTPGDVLVVMGAGDIGLLLGGGCNILRTLQRLLGCDIGLSGVDRDLSDALYDFDGIQADFLQLQRYGFAFLNFIFHCLGGCIDAACDGLYFLLDLPDQFLNLLGALLRSLG